MQGDNDTLPPSSPEVPANTTPAVSITTTQEEEIDTLSNVNNEAYHTNLTTPQIIAKANEALAINDYTAAAQALSMIDTDMMHEVFDNNPAAASDIKFILYTISFSEDAEAIDIASRWDKMITDEFGLRLEEGNY